MKKNLLIAAALLTMALPAAAQMSNIAPAPGSVIDMDEMNFGLNSISFGLPDGSGANRVSRRGGDSSRTRQQQPPGAV